MHHYCLSCDKIVRVYASILLLLGGGLLWVNAYPQQPLGELYSVITIKGVDYEKAEQRWWHERLTPSQHHALIGDAFERVYKGELQVYAPTYPFNKELTKKELERVCLHIDSTYTTDNKGHRVLQTTKEITQPHHINALGFYEDWAFDTTTLQLNREVKGMVFYQCFGSECDDPMVVGKPLFYLPLKSDGAPWKDTDTTRYRITELITEDVTIGNIDRTSTNGHQLDLEAKNSIIEYILRHIKSGQLTAYVPKHPHAKALTPDQVEQLLIEHDTTFYEDFETGELLTEVHTFEYTADDINHCRMYEQWFFDATQLRFEKRVLGMMLYKDALDEMEDISQTPLFYVPLSNQEPFNKNYLGNYTITSKIMYNLNFNKRDGGRFCGTSAANVRQFNALVSDIRSVDDKDRRIDVAPEFQAVKKQYSYAYRGIQPTEINGNNIVVPPNDNVFKPGLVSSINFDEEWEYDFDNNTFKKQINGAWLNLVREKKGDICYSPVYIGFNGWNKPPKKDHLLIKEIEYEVPIKRVHKNKVNYSDWAYNNIDLPQRNKLIQYWLKQTVDGKMKAYRPNAPFDEEIKVSNVKFNYYVIDSTITIEYDEWGEPIERKIEFSRILRASEVGKLRFHEAWYYNPKQFAFHKKVMGVVLVYTKHNSNTGEVKKEVPLVYLKFAD